MFNTDNPSGRALSFDAKGSWFGPGQCKTHVHLKIDSIPIKISFVKVSKNEQNDMLGHHNLPVSWQGSNTSLRHLMSGILLTKATGVTRTHRAICTEFFVTIAGIIR